MKKSSTRSPRTLPDPLMLERAKAGATNDSAVVIIDDDDAIKVAVTLKNTAGVAHWWCKPRDRVDPGASQAEAWAYLLDGWELDYEELGAVAGLSADTVRAKAAILKGNRLVYPDGSLSPGASLAVQAYLKRKLGVKERGQGNVRRQAKEGGGEQG